MKQYNGEKAIISLTSWKARIKTVSKTIYSLIQKCPGFHIVLVLSEEEFPKKEEELPEDLMLFVDNDLIEILWIYKNYKSFKKVLFTMDKYRDVPVISADDDCIYICNYAEELYNKWNTNRNLNGIRYEYGNKPQMQGPTSLYFGFGDKAISIVNSLSPETIKKSEDDIIVYKFMQKLKCKFSFVHNKTKKPYKFHDLIKPLHNNFSSMPCFRSAFDWSKKR